MPDRKSKGPLKLPMVQSRQEQFLNTRERERKQQENLRQQQQLPRPKQHDPPYLKQHNPQQQRLQDQNPRLAEQSYKEQARPLEQQRQNQEQRVPLDQPRQAASLQQGDGQDRQEQPSVPSPLPRPRPLPLPLPRSAVGSPTKARGGLGGRGGAGGGAAGGRGGVAGSPAAPSRLSLPPTQSEEDVDPDDTIKLKLLGHGSSGKVYKVRHKKTGKIYALKVIQEKHELSVRKQILREMDILRRSSSPCIVSCYGVTDKAGEISFVLEYMDGGSLADVLEAKKKVSEKYLSEVARQVLKGLDYLHRNKIVHRDIKPSNLLLNHGEEVKIADFGVSTVLASTLAPCNSFVGTCAYMSPERFDPDSHGGNYSGYSADIWSLGLSLLECAIGHFPFLSPGQKADWPTLMVAICYGDPPQAPADASREFKDFMKHCLWKAPERRPRACDLLTHPFITKYEGSPASISDLLQPLPL